MNLESLKKEAEEYAEENYCEEVRPTARNAYLDCARIKEKRIAELENNLSIANTNIENFLGQITDLAKENVKLEKENAELKDYRLKTLAENQTDIQKYAVNLEHKLSWYDDQLTNAKEIIKKFLLWENDWHDKTESKYELLKQAEQFLNSEVEK